MRKVSVLGWAGHQNFGDEIILEGLKNLFKGWEVTVYSNTPDGKYPSIDFDAVNKGDLFVVGGGELIRKDCLFYYSPLVKYTKIPAFIHRKLLAFDWVKNVKVPKMVLGCGANIDNTWQLNKLVRKELVQFDFIGLRDSFSVARLKAIPELREKVKLCYDLAFAVEPKRATHQRFKDFAVVVPTNRPGYYEFERSKRWLTMNLRCFEKTVFVPFGKVDNDDFATCNQLSKCASHSEVLEPNALNFDRVFTLLSEAEKVFAYRLHGLILAFIAGVEYSFWPYHDKLVRVHHTLKGKSVFNVRLEQFDVFHRGLEACGL
jgi:polysaccharide pyruvyl transferase WcaK-like protein